MLRIRLSRTGKIRQPSYRVVVAEKESKRDGRVIERIGHYNPLTNPAQFDIKEDRALYWLSVGAQPTDAVRVLLQKQGTLDRLARYRAGESLDALVGEYQGVAAPAEATKTPPPAATVEAEAPIVEQVADTVGDAVGVVVAPVVTVADEVKDAVESLIGADEEE
jgi:small subunit ribosomal protein S16